jgi:hypothetical protein
MEECISWVLSLNNGSGCLWGMEYGETRTVAVRSVVMMAADIFLLCQELFQVLHSHLLIYLILGMTL